MALRIAQRWRRRRWWQHALRLVLLLVLLLASAYVTLPWWLPAGWVRGQIEQRLSRRLGVPVRLEEVHLSWSEGLVARGLTISSGESFAHKPLLEVREIRTEFSPITWLIRGQGEWMHVAHPQLHLRLDSQGQSNLEPLTRLKYRGQIRRISLSNAAAHLRIDRDHEPLTVFVHDMQLLAGKIRQVGQITLAGGIDQGDAQAPLILRARIGRRDEDAEAKLTFAFSDVDLSKLYVRQLLDLPLTRLDGRCAGSLVVEVSRQGIVEQLNLEISIASLDVQPKVGPALPVIADAGIALDASYDPLSRNIELRNVRLRVPGLDVKGGGTVTDAILAGRWQAIRRMTLSGQVYPSRLSALLTGEALLGAYELTGPADVRVDMSHEGHVLEIDASAMADGVRIRRDGHVLKPADRALRGAIQAKIDDRTWRMETPNSSLFIGDNAFRGGGTIDDLGQAISILGRRDLSPLAQAVALLQGMQWQGSIQGRDLASLARLLGPEGDFLDRADLGRGLEGDFYLGGAGRSQLAVHLDIPAGADLRLGRWLAQPAEAGMHVMVSGRLDADRVGLSNLAAELALDQQPLVQVSRGWLSLRGLYSQRDDDPLVEAEGRYELSDLEGLIECLPPLSEHQARLSGTTAGTFQLTGEAERTHMVVEADVSRVGLDWPGWIDKPTSARRQPLSLRVSGSFAAGGHWRAGASLDLTDIDSTVSMDLACSGGVIRGDIGVETERPRRILAMLPRASAMAEAIGLAGKTRLDLHGSADWARRRGDFEVSFRTAEATLRMGPDDESTAPAEIRGAVTAAMSEEGGLRVEIDGGRLALGDQRAGIMGFVKLGPLGGRIDSAARLLDRIERGSLKIQGRLTLGPATPAFLPANAWRHVMALRPAGRAELDLTLDIDRKGFGLGASLDAENVELHFAGGRGDAATGPSQGRWRKPGGTRAHLAVEIRAPRDLRSVEVKELALRTDGLAADVQGRLGLGQVRSPGEHELSRLSGAVWTSDARKLARLIPGLADREPKGKALVRLDWRQGPLGPELRGMLRLDRLSAVYRGKRVWAHGQVRLRDASIDLSGHVRDIGQVSTEGLELRAGDNHAWIIGQLEDLTSAPTGKVRVLATHLDEPALRGWLEPSAPPREARAKAQFDAEAVLTRADRLIARAGQVLARADLQVDLQSRRFIALQGRVHRAFDIDGLKLRGSAKQGKLEVSYRGLLNGGTYAATHQVDLNAPQPVVTSTLDMREALAAENLQPQLEREFPGNTAWGTFSRTEETTIPLRKQIASMLDSRVPAWPSGEAKTVTTDGFLVGRAAPEWIASIFPGLNLAHYRYAKMTAFAQLRDDGSTVNDMIFDGEKYDVYMEGRTSAVGQARYEMGLLVLGSGLTPQWHHNWRQGRLPLLKIEAVIENGRIFDQEVSVPWPNETLGAVLIRNSIFYRMWLNWRGKE